MGVIDRASLNRFMGSPSWNTEQQLAADLTCAGVETSLEAALFGAFITPRPWVESARILADGGLVDTTHPVHQVTRLDGGAVLTETTPLPAGWRLQDHRLYQVLLLTDDTSATPTLVSPRWPFVLALDIPPPVGRYYSGRVQIEYLAGWDKDPALMLALLRKAQTLMGNRHDDTMTVRGLTATAPPKLAPEQWTEDELGPLGRYRRLGAGGRR